MSRIGKNPITIPQGVEVKVDGNVATVKGPKGILTKEFLPCTKIEVTEGKAIVSIDSAEHGNIHGLTRSLLNNMVIGVSQGFEKTLEINGVGYKAAKQGKKLVLSLGYSHPVEFEDSEDITIDVPNPNTIIVKGIDKEKVGQMAAIIREKKLPEPYKGKGIKYASERIMRKEGKAGGKK
ncbi:MAG: 50S ribosomal protein L6 [Clostridia bacterium]|nr:50S ribosomal protein L6 [Clostridia bacterium]